MGNQQGQPNLKEYKKELGKEFEVLENLFEGLARQSTGKTVDKATFLRFFDFPGMFGQRLFTLFDAKKNGVIDIEEFMAGMAAYLHASSEERMKLIFNLYDLTGDKHVSQTELTTMLYSLVNSPHILNSFERNADAVEASESADYDQKDADAQEAQDARDSHEADAQEAQDARATDKHQDHMMGVVRAVCKKAFADAKVKKMDYKAFAEWTKKNPQVLEMIDQSFAKYMWSNGTDSSPSSHQKYNEQAVDRGRRRSIVDVPVTCSVCKFQLRFCPHCGSPLKTHSDSPECSTAGCGRILGVGKGLLSFCLQCGDPWTEESAKNPAAMEAARRRRKEAQRSYGARTTSGPLSKMRKHIKTFKEQHYVLRGSFLYTFDHRNDERPCRVMFLEGLFIEIPVEDEYSDRGMYGMQLVSVEETITLFSASIEDRQRWVRALRTGAKNFIISDFYELKEGIGEGRFASVRRALRIDDQKEFAVKVIQKAKVDPLSQDSMRDEIAILKLLKHPNIVSFEEVYETPETLFIVLQWVKGGDMLDHLKEVSRLSEDTSRAVISRVLSALLYCHRRGVVHRDIKPENLLIDDKKDLTHVYLADFGLSSFAAPTEKMDIACGTLSYMAPEMLMLEGYTQAVDMWGVGVLTYILLSGHKPFYDPSRDVVIEKIIEEDVNFSTPKDLWPKISKDAIDFIKRLLDKNPKTRLTVYQARKHPWITQGKKDAPSTPSRDGSLGNISQPFPTSPFKTVADTPTGSRQSSLGSSQWPADQDDASVSNMPNLDAVTEVSDGLQPDESE